MRQRQKATMVLALALMWPAMGFSQQTAEELYQAGLYQEEAQGDLQRAIAIYERILREHPQSRVAGAQAQLHIGLCYETLGQTEAQRAYEQVIQNFADQPEVVSQARARLSALRPAAVAGRGPVARRLLSGDDTDINDFYTMTPSPDGRRVAYVDLELGGIHLRDLVSGTVEQLVSGLPSAFNWSPTWSPDGARLAFQETSMQDSVESIKILDLASRTVVAIPGTDVPYTGRMAKGLTPLDWSRDGRLLLFRTNVNILGSLGIVPVNGGARTMLVDSVPPGQGGCFSPDGRFVVYGAGEQGNEQVFVQPVAGGARRQITDAPEGNGSPLWSPEGDAIAYQRADGIWVVPVADGERSGAPRLAYASRNIYVGTRTAWTRAGGLYLTHNLDDMIPYRLAVDPATGAPNGSLEKLPAYPESIRSFAWAPDMRRGAFGTWTGDLVIYASDGSSKATHAVAPNRPISVLSWSGDGREVFYWYRENESGEFVGFVMALDVTTGVVREVFPRTATRWPRDVRADGRRTLYWYRLDQPDSSASGLVVTEAGRPGGRLVAPTWDADSVPLKGGLTERLSPQGDQVLFVRQARRDSPDAASLWVVASSGTGLRRIGTMKIIVSAVWEPSGRFIAYAGTVDSTTVLRIVEVATGLERGSVPLSDPRWERIELADWSRDGRFIGIAASEPRAEYWVVQGLQEEGR